MEAYFIVNIGSLNATNLIRVVEDVVGFLYFCKKKVAILRQTSINSRGILFLMGTKIKLLIVINFVMKNIPISLYI